MSSSNFALVRVRLRCLGPVLVCCDKMDSGSQWLAEGADGEKIPLCRSWHGADAAAQLSENIEDD